MIRDPHLRAIRFRARRNAQYERARMWRGKRWVLAEWFQMREQHCQWSLFL
jgi:hypothetical protein